MRQVFAFSQLITCVMVNTFTVDALAFICAEDASLEALTVFLLTV